MSGMDYGTEMTDAPHPGSHGSTRGPGGKRTGAALVAMPVLLLGAALTGLAAVSVEAPPSLAPAFPGSAFATCTSGFIGDVTGDDVVNITDAQQIARATVGLSVSGTVQDRLLSHGDVTDDGTTNITDAQQIARWTVGLSTTFPIGEPCSSGTTGDMRAQNTIISGSAPGQPFTVSLDGGSTQDMPPNGSYTFEDVSVGTHSVTIGNLQGCSLGTTSATQEEDVVAGGLTTVGWSIAC